MDNTLIGLVIGLAFIAPVFGLIVWARHTGRLREVEKEGPNSSGSGSGWGDSSGWSSDSSTSDWSSSDSSSHTSSHDSGGGFDGGHSHH